jgi:hypothetical protein
MNPLAFVIVGCVVAVAAIVFALVLVMPEEK